MDGVLVTIECVHSRHRDKLRGLICKLDFEKACDKVEWNFLSYILQRMGFGLKWKKVDLGMCFFGFFFCPSKWIGFFKAQRVLFQGDLLSPFLFVIVGEVLSRMFSMATKANLIRSFKLALEAPMVSYL